MKVINLNSDGRLRDKEQKLLGGIFTFWETIKMKRVGSPKLVYVSGLTEFEELKSISAC